MKINKKSLFISLFASLLLIIGLNSCKENNWITTYWVRDGHLIDVIGSNEQSVSISPESSLKPSLFVDSSKTMTSSEIDALLIHLEFDQNFIQSVKDTLNNNRSAFVLYNNSSGDNRWLWITLIITY
ncbi:hypothetical protein [Treponema sp. R6D11]